MFIILLSQVGSQEFFSLKFNINGSCSLHFYAVFDDYNNNY